MIGPKLQPIPGADLWLVLEDWEWHGFVVPMGFESNLDSIPPIPGIHAWLKGRTRCAALLHDYLYHIKHDRADADNQFKLCMIDEGVEMRHVRPIYAGVRAFGWTRYL